MAADEYLNILDNTVRMLDDARLEANAATARGESPAITLLNYAERIAAAGKYIESEIPNRWRVN